MEIKLEDVKATLIRLQGQIDVWNGLFQELMKEETKNKAKEDANVSATENK